MQQKHNKHKKMNNGSRGSWLMNSSCKKYYNERKRNTSKLKAMTDE